MSNPSKDKNLNEGDSYQSPSLRYGQNHILGIIFVFVSVSAIAFTNVIAKYASDEHHAMEILFYRNGFALLITIMFIYQKYGSFQILKTSRIKHHFRRAIVGTIGVATAFSALKYLPITDATVLLFTIPIFTAILSVPILGERVGPLRWITIFIGFIGVYIAVNPQGGFNLEGVTLCLISALTSGMIALYVRDLGKTEPAIRTVFYFLLFGFIFMLPFMIFLATMPTWAMLGLLSCTGILGFINQFLKANAYAIAPAALLSPFIYTMLIWSILFDIILWNTMPTKQVLIGGAIIIASNLFLAWRERENKQ